MSRIVAVCPKEFPGVSAVFRNGAESGLWEFIELGSRIPLDTSLIIVGGWLDGYLQFLNNPQSPVVVFFTSTIGQMEFSLDQVEFLQCRIVHQLVSQNIVKCVLVGWPDLIDFVFSDCKARNRGFYFPYPISLKESRTPGIQDKISNSIGIFSPRAPRKNLQNQILAATSIGELHTNVILGVGDRQVKYYNWQTRQDYLDCLSKLTVSLHCGFTESLCYAAIDSILAGVIPVISLQVAENLGISMLSPIVVHQVDSVTNIRRRIQDVLSWDEKAYLAVLNELRDSLKRTAERNYAEDKIILDKLAE